MNANWTPGAGFELLVVTEDGERRTVPVAPDELAALGAILGPDRVLLWDPEGGTLIVANIVGDWLPQDFPTS